ncbi:hypothetical protein F4604DRAFT_1688616 [Suillus subluteus]|nr:hypothetical protein F4604DRAFT_1688616 [Suillus subluteus]
MQNATLKSKNHGAATEAFKFKCVTHEKNEKNVVSYRMDWHKDHTEGFNAQFKALEVALCFSQTAVRGNNNPVRSKPIQPHMPEAKLLLMQPFYYWGSQETISSAPATAQVITSQNKSPRHDICSSGITACVSHIPHQVVVPLSVEPYLSNLSPLQTHQPQNILPQSMSRGTSGVSTVELRGATPLSPPFRLPQIGWGTLAGLRTQDAVADEEDCNVASVPCAMLYFYVST